MAMSLGTAGDDEDALNASINTTPLVDVMLVLLIMFIITIPIQTHAVKMNMPVPSEAAPPPVPPEVVRLDVDAEGRIGWNGDVLADRTALEARLKAAATQPEQPEIHLRPDRGVAYKHVAAILAAAQRLGANKIGLVGNEQFLDEAP